MFDSHARDVYGKSHTRGTCGPLDISSTDNLVHHFQSLNGATDLYELKDLQITKYDVEISNNVKEVLKRYQVNTSVIKTTVLQKFFILRYSIISPSSYWNSNTLDAIIENGSQLNNTMQSKYCLTSVTLPDSVTIFGTNINVHVNEVSYRESSN